MNQSNALSGSHHRRWPDCIVVLILFLSGMCAGMAYLNAVRTNRSAIQGIEYLYGPSVMFAAGRGFYSPDINASPELRAFVRNEVENLNPKVLPPDIPQQDSTVAAYHLYLLYIVAAFWWLFGISWGSLEPLAAIMLGWYAAAAYGLFRLGMGRVVSLVCAVILMLSPPILIMLPNLRDFSKAPFILTIIFLLVYLIKVKPSLSRLAVYLPLLGLLIGVGMGFRQDIIIFIPTAILVACISLYRVGNASLLRRCVVAALFLACLFGTASPMLGKMEGGAQPYHPLVQGYSMKRMESLGIAPAAYAPLASGQDNYVFSVLYDYYRRVNSKPNAHFSYNSPGAEAAGRQWLIDMGVHFPADILTRGYASVLRSLRYADAYTPWFSQFPSGLRGIENIHLGFAAFMHRFGLLLGMAALLCIGVRNLTAGLGLIVFVVYVFGYVGLQCEFRHAFHFAFIPFWVMGFLTSTALHGLWFYQPAGFQKVRTALVRSFLFVLFAAVLVIVPLGILRLYQQRMAERVVAPILSASLKPVDIVRTADAHGWTLFTVEPGADEAPTVKKSYANYTDQQALWASLALLLKQLGLEGPVWNTRTRLMMVEFDAAKMPEWFCIRYTSRGAWNDFSQVVHLPAAPKGQHVVHYYFPVYELYMPDDKVTARNEFSAIGVPKGYEGSLLNVYQAAETSDCRFLLHLMADSSSVFEPLYQRINFFPDPVYYYLVENDPVGVGTMAEFIARTGNYGQTVFFYRTAALLSSDAPYRLYIARKLLQMNAFEASIECVLDERNQGNNIERQSVDLLLDIGTQCEAYSRTDIIGKIFPAVEKLIAYASPERLGQAAAFWGKQGNKKAGLQLYHKIMQAYPENTAVAGDINFLLDPDEELSFWKSIAEDVPESALPWLTLGEIYEERGEEESAMKAFMTAHANNPENLEAALKCYDASPENYSPDEIIRTADTVLAAAPELANLAAECLNRALVFYTEKGEMDNAQKMLDAVLRLAPQNQFARIRAAEALAVAGDVSGARKQLVSLLHEEPCDSVAEALQKILRENAPESERLAFWEDQVSKGSKCAPIYYGIELADAGRYEDAAALLDSLQQYGSLTPELELRQRIILLAAGREQQETPFHVYVKEQHPDLALFAAQLLLQTAETLSGQQHTAAAEIVAREAVALAPEMEAAWLALGQMLESQGRNTDALQIYKESFAAASPTEQTALRMDALYDATGDPNAKQKGWHDIVALHPGNVAALMHWGMACEMVGDYEQAREAYMRLIDAGQGDPMARLRLGGVMACLGEIEPGIEMIKQSAAEESLKQTAGWICQNAGRVLSEKGDLAAALLFYQRANEYVPDDPFTLLQQGNLLQQQGMKDAALSAYRRAIAVGKEMPAAMESARQADMLLDAGERVRFWSECHADMPDVLLPALRYAFALAETDITAATDLVEKLAATYPENAEIKLIRSVADYVADEEQSGIAAIQKVVADNPHLVPEAAALTVAVASSTMQKGETEIALHLFETAAQLEPENLAYTVMLGEAFLAAGENRAAVDQFRKVLMKAPGSPRSARLLEEACKRLGDMELYRSILQEITAAHPGTKIPVEQGDAH